MSTTALTTIKQVAYEHPTNEQARLYLRLEYLFKTYHKYRHKMNNSKMALITLLQLASIVDRPDLKSKLVQLLTLISGNLTRLSQIPSVDHNKLKEVLTQIHHSINYLDKQKDKIAKEIRKHDFLNQVRLNLTHPAGPSEQSLHTLNLWLNQPDQDKATYLDHWFKYLTPLEQTIKLLLSLMRQSTRTETHLAKGGVFQITQESNLPCEIIRVIIPTDAIVFPEISANKHKIMVRFLKPDFISGQKAKPFTGDIEFQLIYCKI